MLDVCVDYTGDDGVADMDEVAGRFATQATCPSCSTRPSRRSSRPACSASPAGPSSTRSTSRTATPPGTRLDRFLTLAREYGAAVVCTCIDTEGQARTAEWKLRAAQAIHDLAVDRYGLRPERPALRPPGPPPVHRHGGEPAGRHRDHRGNHGGSRPSCPASTRSLGLSNVSFGLNPAARHVLNSMFLHECQQAGLDAAIVHAARIMPLPRSTPGPARCAST